MIEPFRSQALRQTRHGFFGRPGGVSTGIVSGLNVGLGSSDDPAAVEENRRRAVEAAAPGATLVTAYQVHSAACVTAAGWEPGNRPQADALVTDRPGFVLGIVTADCAPVLLADVEGGVVGAAHAGWKGALSGINEATVEAMEKLGGRRDRIVAAVGPCIARKSYEVDDAFQQRFCASDPATERFFGSGNVPGHVQFDLEAYVAHRLFAAGVGHVDLLGHDTYSNSQQFFSFRRATHAGEPDYGRQISLIALT